MLVTDIIQRAIAGKLHFDFIESIVMVKRGSMVSSQKGVATSYSGDGTFLYHFTPRGTLREEWVAPGGYLDASADASFEVSGVERGSANWSGELTRLNLTPGANGALIHGRVQQWTRADERSARNAFRRIIIPGKVPFPALIRHALGHHSRVASIHFETSCLEFRDYETYAEISVINGAELPSYFLEYAVSALRAVLDLPLDWVYKERHVGRQRLVTVQRPEFAIEQPASAMKRSYHDFWQAYSEELAARL